MIDLIKIKNKNKKINIINIVEIIDIVNK